MQILRVSALAALLAAPAWADPATDYARLRAAITGVYLGPDGPLQAQSQIDLISRLKGRWISLSVLMNKRTDFPDELIADTCKRRSYDVAPKGKLGFTLTVHTESDPYVITVVYVGGTTYLSSVDEAGAMARFFPDKPADDIDLAMLNNAIIRNPWNGYFTLLPFGEDLLLVQHLGRIPELLARCP